MMQPRDHRVLHHLGYHGWLSHYQLQRLEFPSYQRLQARIREELLKDNWIDREYLPKGNSKIPIFRLSSKGKKWFEKDTGHKAYRPRFSQLKVPHRLLVNELLIMLKCKNIIPINGFKLEKKCGSIRPDAYVYNNVEFCLEVDRSGTERKDFIQKKWIQYEREFMQGNLGCRFVVWYSKRSDTLFNWIDKKTNLVPIFINKKEKIFDVINHISPGIKSSIK